jgi:hypothetical protein
LQLDPSGFSVTPFCDRPRTTIRSRRLDGGPGGAGGGVVGTGSPLPRYTTGP